MPGPATHDMFPAALHDGHLDRVDDVGPGSDGQQQQHGRDGRP